MNPLAEALGLMDVASPLGIPAGPARRQSRRADRDRARGEAVPLADGTVGFLSPEDRDDDCYREVVATVLQIPLGELPDARLDERVREGEEPSRVDQIAKRSMRAFLEERGLREVIHPVGALPCHGRWVGIGEEPGWFKSHALAMGGRGVLFDPARAAVHIRGRIWRRSQGFESLLAATDPLAYAEMPAEPEWDSSVRFFDARDLSYGITFEPIGA